MHANLNYTAFGVVTLVASRLNQPHSAAAFWTI